MENKKKVLVVDDEPGILRFTKMNLSLAGFDVVTTTNGQEALSLVKTESPDIVLLDVLMFPIGGFEVLESLRRFSPVPVIVFTASSFIANQAIKFGANGFIDKPFRPEDLIAKIKEILAEKKSAD